MGIALDRIDPASLEKGQIDRLLQALRSEGCLVGSEGEPFALPEPLARFIAYAAEAMRHGQSVALVPDKATLTTQEAADYLGFSRPILIGVLEKGEISFHMVGTHRRIKQDDLLAYREKQDRERRKALDEVFDAIDQDGLYWLGLDPKLERDL